MEQLLNSLGDPSQSDQAGAAGGDGGIHLTNSDLNPNMEDVIKVLSDLDEEFVQAATAGEADARGVAAGQLNSVHDVSHLVDKAAMAEERLTELKERQEALERRFRLVTKRVDLVRFRHLGSHVAEELSKLRELSEEIVPAALPAAPRFDPFNLNVIRPPNVPDGVVLPSVPSTEVLARPTTTLTTSDGKVSSSARGHPSSAPPLMLKEEAEKRGEGPAADERERADEVLGQMESNLKHMVQSYDSDATESSSGGESCDEGETYPEKNQDYVPIRRRAQWAWLTNRAGIASKWTWLTAQISDLEYRIRQQTEFYRQIRAAKGGVTLGEPVVSWPPHARKPVQSQVRPDRDVPLNCKPVTKDYSRVDSTGRKIIIKEPSSPQLESPQPPVVAAPPPPPPPALMASPTPLSASDPDDNSLGACRTRPVKMIRRRRILSTQGIFRTSARAAKESTVRCDCIHPLFCCSICYGRLNHTQVPDPITQERNQCMALLDHSYHQVLSTVEDAPLDVLFMQKIKNRSWADPRSLGFARDEEGVRKRLKKVKKEEDGEKQSAGGSATADGEPIKKKKRLKVRPSKTKDGKKVVKKDGLKKKRPVVQHYNDDRGTFLNDMSSDGDTMSGADGNSPVHSPSVPSSNQAWADHIRRKRETAFDIDNIVIPYSIAAATRVERIKYKEILTPTWRTAEDEEREGEMKPSEEDITLSSYENRHAKAEQEEKRRWQLPLWKSSGGQRSRSRRQDSCRTEASSGCNTPDPLSPGMVEKVDSLEVNTRPSTPVNVASEENSNSAPGTMEKTPGGGGGGGGQSSAPSSAASTPQAAGSIRNRRRTSSATKSRERNPSEDTQSSRCTTPTQEQQSQQQPQQQPQPPSSQDSVDVAPFEPRTFPLSKEDYTRMVAEMPNEAESGGNGDGKTDSRGDTNVVGEGNNGGNVAAAAAVAAAAGLVTPGGSGGNRRGSSSSAHNGSSGYHQQHHGNPLLVSPGHSSSAEEDGEDTEDPDWKCEVEEDDPEWSEERRGAGSAAASSNSHKAQKKGHGLTLKMPQKRT